MTKKTETRYLMDVTLDFTRFQADLITTMNTQTAATVAIIEALVPLMRNAGCSHEEVLAVTAPIKSSMESLGGVIEKFQELTTKLSEATSVFTSESGDEDV